ncbi:MAG: copper chaperone PCu(A)C [Gemmatimonadales bacterium]
MIGGGQSAFVSIRNDGGAADTVIRFVSPLADAVTLHQTLVRNGTARMTEAERLVLEPGRTAVMASGGLHLMLRGVAPALAPGDSLPLELILALAGRVVVSVPVVAFADAP